MSKNQNSVEQEKNTLIGAAYENAFAKYIDKHLIPYLYIGQEAYDKTHSHVLKICGTHRPDFFIRTENTGAVFIDVKSRRKKSFGNEKRFYANAEEIDNLFTIQSYLFMPLWLAFVEKKYDDIKDISSIENAKDLTFYLAPIQILKTHKDMMLLDLGNEYKLKKDLFVSLPDSMIRCSIDWNTFSLHNETKAYSDFENEKNIHKTVFDKVNTP